MSKLVDSMRAYQTDKRGYLPSELVSFEGRFTELRVSDTLLYRFTTTLGIEIPIREDLANSNIGILEETLRATRRLIADHVFGEYREPLMKMYHKAARTGDKESTELVCEILDSMFKV